MASEHAIQWYARSERCKLRHIRLVPAKQQGWKKEGYANGALSNAPGIFVEVNCTAYTAAAAKL